MRPAPAPGGVARAAHPLRDRRAAALYVAAWLPVVAAYAVGISATGAPVGDALQSAVLSALPAMLLGAPAIGSAVRLAGTGRGAPLAARHAWRALLFATAWCAATGLQIFAFAPRRVFDAFVVQNAPWQWVSGLFLYGVFAGVGHVVAVGRLLREREAAAARAELHALRAQLDPHFLFNTLHSLTALARRDPAAVERGLERFGSLLRYVLEANRREGPAGATPRGVSDARGGAWPGAVGDADAPLDEELAFVRDYLALERLRLGDRLRVSELVDDEALECAVPALTLQPLVENAVRHSIAPRAAGGALRIAAWVDAEDRLVVEVGDDGPGCAAPPPEPGRGVGLDVVRRRLAARYGVAARLEVVTAPGQGFVARVVVPAHSAGRRRVLVQGAVPSLAGGVPA